MQFKEIQALAARDMEGVNCHIRSKLHSDVVLIRQMAEYIIGSGGRRLRPVLAVLSARACGYQGEAHTSTAAVIEFIHTATLLHDDVVDASDLRRGKETANSIWGNEASVLVGDFIFSRAFQMMVEIADLRVMEILSKASNTIAEGEVLQLMNCNDPETTQARYMEVIRFKTAKLFEAATQVGAVLAHRTASLEADLAAYGMHLGTAFQLIDDVLDYRADSDTIGKNVGDDLAEGKPTLPIIFALSQATPEQTAHLSQVIRQGDRDQLDSVLDIIKSTGAVEFTERVAHQEVEQAKLRLAALDDTDYKTAMLALADFSASRLY